MDFLFGCVIGWFSHRYWEPIYEWFKAKEKKVVQSIKDDAKR